MLNGASEDEALQSMTSSHLLELLVEIGAGEPPLKQAEGSIKILDMHEVRTTVAVRVALG